MQRPPRITLGGFQLSRQFRRRFQLSLKSFFQTLEPAVHGYASRQFVASSSHNNHKPPSLNHHGPLLLLTFHDAQAPSAKADMHPIDAGACQLLRELGGDSGSGGSHERRTGAGGEVAGESIVFT
jgi:hypothetical protein